MSEIPHTNLYREIHNFDLPPESFIVAGSSAIEVVVGPNIRQGNDRDIVVRPDVYDYLRNVRRVHEEVDPNDGYKHLVGEGFDVTLSCDGKTVDELQRGGYQRNGIHFAGLPDVYEYKQGRGQPKDIRDLELIRQRLYGNKPLPADMLGGEMDFIQGITPERLHGHPALHVAANGLYIVRTVFGHEGEGVRTYSGTVEKGAVSATYHAWEHSAYGARDGQRSMDAGDEQWRREGRPGRRYSDNQRLSGLGFTNHDLILGHGRRAVNPEAHDEKQAAEVLVRHLEAAGVDDQELLDGSYETVIVTAWSEEKKSQDIDPARGHLPEQENGSGMDMSALRREDGPKNAARLVPEDLGRIGAGYVGPSGERGPLDDLVRELNAKRPAGTPPIRIKTPEDGWRLIGQHPDYPVVKMTPDGPKKMTLLEAAGGHLVGSGGYYRKFRFPGGWLYGDPAVQEQSAGELERIGEGVKSGEIPASEVMELTQAYSDRVRAAQQSSGHSEQAFRRTAARDEVGGHTGDPIIEAIHRTIDTMRTDGEG
jgi:hypothetical protein